MMLVEMEHGMEAESVAQGAVDHLTRTLDAPGGVIVLPREGSPRAAYNTPAMPWAMAE